MRVKIGDFQPTDEMMRAVLDVVDSGRLSPGPYVAKFEQDFAEYHNSAQAVMTNSGTSALLVALQALKVVEEWEDGTEVICPAITFVATINAVIHSNLKPVLVDVDPSTYTLDPSLIEAAITHRTVAILPVHAFGLPADMTPILEIATDHNLRVVEDACEALGATYNGYAAGSMGDIGCFSFYMSHHITAGVGGMSITDNPRYAKTMRSLINHGWDRKVYGADEVDYDFEQVRRRYYFPLIGHSLRATEFEAAIALPQLTTLKDNIKARVSHAKAITAALQPYVDRLQLPRCLYNRSHSLMMYPIVVKKGEKWPLIAHLEQAGIETREMLPLTNQPCYDGLFDEDDYPIAKWINRQGFYVSCSNVMTEAERDYMIGKIKEAVA